MNNIGTIIKIDRNEAIVMTDDCVFKKIKKEKSMYLGQKILVDDEYGINRGKRVNHYIGVLAGIAAVFLVLFSYNVFTRWNSIYAHIDVDINPSLSFLIGSNGKVKEVDAINDDARRVIRDIDFKGMFLKEAVLSLIDVSREQGIIDDSNTNHILICAAVNQNYKGKSKDISLGVEGIEDMLYDIETDISKVYSGMIQSEAIQVSSKYMEISEKNNLSIGRCLVYEKARKMGLDLSMEELKSSRLIDILKKYNIDFSDLEDLSLGTSETPNDNQMSTLEPTTLLPTLTPTLEKPTEISKSSSTPTVTADIEPTLTLTATLAPTVAVTEKSTPTPTPKSTPTPKPTPTTVKNGYGSGLRGEYYENMDLTMFKFARVDPVIDFEWGEKSPDNAIKVDSYSIRWTGSVEPRYSETYTFYTCTDDGVKLWVNGILLVDEWKSQSASEYSGKINLKAGEKYEIKMEYYEHRRGASAKLMWSSKSQGKEIIPSSQLYPCDEPLPRQPENGLKAKYFGDKELKDFRLSRTDDVIDFDWQRKHPVSDIKEERFSVRWTGKIQSKYTEEYTFHTLSDDGVRVWINNVLIIDNWDRQEKETETTGEYEFKEGKQYDIKIEYFNYGGPSSMKLLWSSRRQNKEVVPSKYLFTF